MFETALFKLSCCAIQFFTVMSLCLQGALCNDAVLEETGGEWGEEEGPACAGLGDGRSGNGGEEEDPLSQAVWRRIERNNIVAWDGRRSYALGV